MQQLRGNKGKKKIERWEENYAKNNIVLTFWKLRSGARTQP